MRYTYKCNGCSTRFETIMPLAKYVDGTTTVQCPKCGKTDVKRVYLIPVAIYKDPDFTKHVEPEE